jgi:hypothetical protein
VDQYQICVGHEPNSFIYILFTGGSLVILPTATAPRSLPTRRTSPTSRRGCSPPHIHRAHPETPPRLPLRTPTLTNVAYRRPIALHGLRAHCYACLPSPPLALNGTNKLQWQPLTLNGTNTYH